MPPGRCAPAVRTAGSQTVIPVGPGPSYPRVPRGITQPPEPFGPQSGLGIEPLSPLPESERPLSGSFGVARLGDLEGPPTGLTIDQAIDRVLRINLELRAQAMEISKARADVLTAGLRGNPLIYLDSSLVPYSTFAGTAGGPTQYDVNITHPLDLNHKRRHRIEVAVRAERSPRPSTRMRSDSSLTTSTPRGSTYSPPKRRFASSSRAWKAWPIIRR